MTVSSNRMMRDMMSQLFQNEQSDRPSTSHRVSIDAWLTDQALVIQANLPGADPERIQVDLEGDTLTISAELPKPEPTGQLLALERPYGLCTRSLTLNIPIQTDKIDAVCKNGVLTLTLPKAERLRPRQIQVRTN